MRDLESRVNAKRSVIERALKILEVDGAVVHEGGEWLRTVNPWSADSARVAGVTEARRTEQDAMREYVQAGGCLMRFLTRELDDPAEEPCGRCAVCTGDFADSAPEPALVQEAQLFLRRSYRPILPRRQWPAGLDMRSGRIPVEHQLREGRALAIYGDAGWGRQSGRASTVTRASPTTRSNGRDDHERSSAGSLPDLGDGRSLAPSP